MEKDDGGPLVNGRPALTIRAVQSWCRSAHMHGVSDTAAAEVACQLNHAALLRTQWSPEFAELRKANPSTKRIRRVADALATLRDDLPGLIDDSRAAKPDADMTLTEALLDLVQKHQPILDKHPLARGRPRDLAGNVAANIGKLVSKLCDSRHITTKAHDAFVASAMAWLLQNRPTDTAISRNRRRRAQRA